MTRHLLDDSANPVEGFYYPTPVTPEEAFVAIGRLRKAARDEIERLIDWLDSTDDHMEREQNGDELDASYPEGGARMCTPNEDDEQDDPDEDGAIEEYSLGSLDSKDDQTAWAAGGRGDQELDPAESGIADYDGLLEQVGCGGWQRTGLG